MTTMTGTARKQTAPEPLRVILQRLISIHAGLAEMLPGDVEIQRRTLERLDDLVQYSREALPEH